MKWKVEPVPDKGTLRTRKVFAFFRTKIKSYWIWLQFYYVTERYYKSESSENGWWVQISKSENLNE